MLYIKWEERKQKTAEDKKTRTQKSRRDMTVKKVKKFLSFLQQQRKYLKTAPGTVLPRTKSTITEDLLVPHANADVQVKCLNPETRNRPLRMSSSPDWA